MKLRCIIIDDEYLARQRLLKLVEPYDEIHVVAECRNGAEAIEKIHIKKPDIIFLDIQMPDMNGFEVLTKLKIHPHIIFTTAYDSYAIKAFEVNAVDYLLKPFDEDRIRIALDRAFALKKEKKEAHIEGRIKKLMQTYEAKNSEFLSQFSIQNKGRETTVFVDDIVYFKSDGNYVRIITDEKTYLYRKTISSIHENINPEDFLRIHRSLILKKTYIQDTKYLGNNTYQFQLKNGELRTSSRTYKSQIAIYLSEIRL